MGPATLASVSAEIVDKAGCESWLESFSDGNPFRLKSRQPWCLSLTSVWLGWKIVVLLCAIGFRIFNLIIVTSLVYFWFLF